MQKSRALLLSDFETKWYSLWAKKLRQTNAGKGKYSLKSNKFWQNAVIAQTLYEKDLLRPGKKGLGFGVGMERLPALFASMGVHVTATDQDFTKSNAASWNNDQLAHGSFSLNRDAICPEDMFTRNVSFLTANMNKIPAGLRKGQYDFLWSNCALGHLGSINQSLGFIEESLDCLKPGGWAVHTTEFNILSNSQTLDYADTVFLRLADFLRLALLLNQKGYKVIPLHFNLHKTNQDLRYTLAPKWGNDFSKILFNGYFATQVLLIISKPKTTNALGRSVRSAKLRYSYIKNLALIKAFKQRSEIKQLLNDDELAKRISAKDTEILPLHKTIKIQVNRVNSNVVKIGYKNLSNAGLFNIYNCFEGTNPVSLSTAEPYDHNSIFHDSTWRTPNRPSVSFINADDRKSKKVDYVRPNSSFYAQFQLSCRDLAPGLYEENFCLMKEFDGPIPGTNVTLRISVK